MKPPRIALDTNVLVSFLLGVKPVSASAACIARIGAAAWTPVSSTATWLEYEDVLGRSELKLNRGKVAEFLSALGDLVEWHHARPSPVQANDPGDQLWLDLLSGSSADALATFNLRDFREAIASGLPVMRPVEALREF